MSGGTWRWVQCVPAWATLALLAGLTVALRLPFLTPRLAHWDAVNYALGLHEFNVAAHQPHPPGSPLYILLGRAALSVVGDDNAALILVSVVASVGAVLLEYVLARLLFGQRAGLVAAALLLSQPIFWGYGTLATPWTLLSCLALAIGVCALLLRRGRRWLVFPSAALVGLGSGFRLDA
ncbi:MAG TPA: glycosyltransferase family 39 protein, partial [Chloroflexota bacterium]